jgi:hypothetical protein
VNNTDGAIISIGLAILLLACAGMLVIEGYLLFKRHHPITSYSRNLILNWPGVSIAMGMLLVFGTGMLVGHFFWDAACGIVVAPVTVIPTVIPPE